MGDLATPLCTPLWDTPLWDLLLLCTPLWDLLLLPWDPLLLLLPLVPTPVALVTTPVALTGTQDVRLKADTVTTLTYAKMTVCATKPPTLANTQQPSQPAKF